LLKFCTAVTPSGIPTHEVKMVATTAMMANPFMIFIVFLFIQISVKSVKQNYRIVGNVFILFVY
jgi:hypothetical protein